MPFRSSSWPAALLLLLASLSLAPDAAARDPLWQTLPWDERMGVSWYEKRGAQGDVAAQVRAAQMHEQGIGTEADPAEAARWYARAAAQGHPLALFKTARAWQTGLLGRVDLAKAADLYRAAAQAGVGAASFNLAVMAENGQGIPRDRARAATLYAQAWRQGVAKAGLSLGLLRLTGRDSDPLAAYAWLTAAAEAGVAGAARQRDRLAEILGPEAVAQAAARRLPPLGGQNSPEDNAEAGG